MLAEVSTGILWNPAVTWINHRQSNAIVERGPFFASCRTKTISVNLRNFLCFFVSHRRNMSGKRMFVVTERCFFFGRGGEGDQKKAATHIPTPNLHGWVHSNTRAGTGMRQNVSRTGAWTDTMAQEMKDGVRSCDWRSTRGRHCGQRAEERHSCVMQFCLPTEVAARIKGVTFDTGARCSKATNLPSSETVLRALGHRSLPGCPCQRCSAQVRKVAKTKAPVAACTPETAQFAPPLSDREGCVVFKVNLTWSSTFWSWTLLEV